MLVTYNQVLLSQIKQLLIFIAKNIPLSKPKYDMTSPKYKKMLIWGYLHAIRRLLYGKSMVSKYLMSWLAG